MKILMQNVDKCKVINVKKNEVINEIINGNVFYIGIEKIDLTKPIDSVIEHAVKTILLCNENKNLMLLSQFTLMAQFKNNKPSFHQAADPENASIIFNKLFQKLLLYNTHFDIKKGEFRTYLYIDCVSTNLKSLFFEI